MKGFEFVRLSPTSRAANSSGAFSEGWAIDRHQVASRIEAHRKLGVFVQYADLTNLMLMLDLRLGGGVMDAVNEGQKLFRPRAAPRGAGPIPPKDSFEYSSDQNDLKNIRTQLQVHADRPWKLKVGVPKNHPEV